jgi:HTH-type transcriptional regulator / antitoxin HigA
MANRVAAEVFPPGEFIREELDARGWTQGVLAEVMGRPERMVSEIISGKRAITPETAKGLAAAFGTDPTFWINLEGAYRLSKAEHCDDEVRRRSAVYSFAPVKEMIRRGWIEISENVDVLEQRIMGFFGVRSLTETPSFLGSAKATAAPTTSAQMAWLFRVKQIAQRLMVPSYSDAKLRDAMPVIRSLMKDPDDAAKVPRILAECGIRFVIVEGMPSGKIDGVCFWLEDGTSPVVGMSLRFDRIDNFWFVLRHELEHVLRHHGVDAIMLDSDLLSEASEDSADLPEEEILANAAASDFCVSKAKMDSWIARKSPFFSETDLIGFSKLQGVHPGVVAGQLRHRIKKYRLFTKYLAKIRHVVVATAVVDGWGETYPTT